MRLGKSGLKHISVSVVDGNSVHVEWMSGEMSISYDIICIPSSIPSSEKDYFVIFLQNNFITKRDILIFFKKDLLIYSKLIYISEFWINK